MFSVVFLVLSTMVGYAISKLCLREFFAETAADDIDSVDAPKLMLRLPVAFVVGIITAGLLTYFCCLIWAPTGRGMLYGSVLAMVLMSAFLIIFISARPDFGFRELHPRCVLQRAVTGYLNHTFLCRFFAVLAVFLTWFFFYSFYVKDGAIHAGYTVFSDFGPHVALIRSFSVGNNFPAQYPHFPDGSMYYHFMFHFVAGVLEFLGLRIDFAMNTLSLMCLLCCLSLLYVLTVRLTKSMAAGVIAIVLFLFRSSFAVFTYMFDGTQYESGLQFLTKLLNPQGFIGNTQNEAWGLWSNNVYANQRHLSLGISLILIAVLAFLPLVKSRQRGTGGRFSWLFSSIHSVFARLYVSPPHTRARIECIDEKKKGTTRTVPLFPFVGLLLGAATYFHGSGVIAALGILAVMALFSVRKLEYVVVAAITVAISLAQNIYFSAGAPSVDPKFQFGFLVADPTAGNIALYLIELTGVIFAVAIAGIILLRRSRGLQMGAAFLVPTVLTFTLSLTPDITVNHKFLMISITLLNIYAAYVIVWVAEFFAKRKRSIIGPVIAAVLMLLLTISGVVDTLAYVNNNGAKRSAVYADKTSATVNWIRENTAPGSVFISAWHVQSPILLAGRFEFLGWPYFGWSAGYDTFERRQTIIGIFNIRDPGELNAALKENNISYVFVDSALMNDDEIRADPETLAAALTQVFYNDTEKTAIFKVGD